MGTFIRQRWLIPHHFSTTKSATAPDSFLLVDDGDAIKEVIWLQLPTLRLFTLLERAAVKNLLDLTETIRRISQTTFRLPPADAIAALLARNAERKRGKA